MEVIGVGIAIIDVIHEVAAYPEGVPLLAAIGGNVTNALVVCAQLGGRCRWLGVSTDPEKDSDAAFVHNDLAAFGVDCSLASIETQGNMPVSYIVSSRATGSRTIVHSRNLVELSYEAFVKQFTLYRGELQEDASKPVWFHFEGRNVDATQKMMLHVRENMPAAEMSIEIEALRNDWGSAMNGLHIHFQGLYPSKTCLSKRRTVFRGCSWEAVGKRIDTTRESLHLPLGAEGVYFLNVPGSVTYHLPTPRLDKVVETIGAGDSFIGASLAGFSCGNVPLENVLKTACEVASAKCLKQGFALSLEEQTNWQKKLQSEKEVSVPTQLNPLKTIQSSACQRERRAFMQFSDSIRRRQWTHLVVRSDHIAQEINELVRRQSGGCILLIGQSCRRILPFIPQGSTVTSIRLQEVPAAGGTTFGAGTRPPFVLLDFNRSVDLRVKSIQECCVRRMNATAIIAFSEARVANMPPPIHVALRQKGANVWTMTAHGSRGIWHNHITVGHRYQCSIPKAPERADELRVGVAHNFKQRTR
ncbi:Ribokinase-like [Phytophthora cactorum]|nr:Ribokinase-like [Phytophthora cactorum]